MIPMASGGLAPPLVDVLTRPEVLTALGGALVAILGSIAALFAYLRRKLDALNSKTEVTKAAALVAKEQTGNTHSVNLRDDIDHFREEMRDGFKRMDHQFGEVHERQIQIDRRVEGVETRATEEHRRIWQTIDPHRQREH